MHLPRLRYVHPESLPARLLVSVRTMVAGPVRLFVVVHPGVWDGRPWGVGDVIVCDTRSPHVGRTVLEPDGRGRPVLGRVDGDLLTGSHGEPCHPKRWRAVGALVTVLPKALDVRPEPEPVPPRVGLPAPGPRVAPQLSLFVAG